MNQPASINNDVIQPEVARNSSCQISLIGMRRIEQIASTEELLPEAIQTQMELLDKYYDRIAKKIDELDSAGAISFAESSANQVMMLEADMLYSTLKTQLEEN